MTTYNPPDPNINTFNNAYWGNQNTIPLTEQTADLLYLQYPIAQGDEILKNITVQGIINVTVGSNDLILNSNATTGQYSPSVQAGNQVIAATGTIDREILVLTTQTASNTHIKIEDFNLSIVANGMLSLIGNNEISATTPNFNFNGALNNRGILNVMTPNNQNDNRMLFNTNPTISLYNPCVTSTSQQVIASTGTINSESLVLTTQSSTNNGIIINNTNVNFTSLSAPTSNQSLLPNSDNSNKIPTTAWIQSILGSVSGTIYTTKYTTNQTVITPSNCRSIDLVIMGTGGGSGSTLLGPPVYYGSSGSGGNTIVGNGIPMGSNESLVLSFSLSSNTSSSANIGSSTVTLNNVILGQAFNGNKGFDGDSFFGIVPGAFVNTTAGVGNTSFGSWYNTYGSAGAISGGTTGNLPPVMSSFGCPKGSSVWSQSGAGMAQREPSNPQGKGYVLITYHLG